MSVMNRAHIFVSGKVQGVFYRRYAQQEAVKLGLTGWVKNLRDGRVEIVADGTRNTLEELVTWCWTGSPRSSVKNVETLWEESLDPPFTDFSVN